MTIEIRSRLSNRVLFSCEAANVKEAIAAAIKLKVDLCGADLSGTDLHRADLRGADLRGVDLSGTDLRMANLSGTNLGGADLRGADLRQAEGTFFFNFGIKLKVVE